MQPQRRFLLQMAGESGTGKSTIARAVGRATGAIVLDKDRIKGPLMEGGLSDPLAGGLSYDVFWSVASSILDQGFNVVLDTAAFYERVLRNGRALAREYGLDYRVIECVCGSEAVHAERLEARNRLLSQPPSLAVVQAQRTEVKRDPLTAPRLVVETNRSLEICLAEVLEYIQT